jgi:hypothetical protein
MTDETIDPTLKPWTWQKFMTVSCNRLTLQFEFRGDQLDEMWLHKLTRSICFFQDRNRCAVDLDVNGFLHPSRFAKLPPWGKVLWKQHGPMIKTQFVTSSQNA